MKTNHGKPLILIVDDDLAVRTSLVLLLDQEGFATTQASNPSEALASIAAQLPDLVLLDLNYSASISGQEGIELLQAVQGRYPSLPVILITAWASIDLAVKGMKAGARDFVHKPWNNDHLLQSVRTALELSQQLPKLLSRRKLDEQYHFSHIIGEAPPLLTLLEAVGRIAPTDASVLLLGESGTGKELIAEALHQNSRRKDQAFVKVNLGGISASLFESELFGHVRGAFTDARFDRTGRFEMANRGAIFLDEIGELDLSSQVKLLRVLQDRTYEVLGSSRTKTLDVRVICATNRNLEEMVAQGLFREDLLYRINLITLHVPPLRERNSDIPLLVQFFLDNLKTLYGRPELEIDATAMRWLQGLPFPGNIRQLKNLVERVVLLSAHSRLGIEDFQRQVQAPPATTVDLPEVGAVTLEEMEIQMIKKAMEYHHYKVAKAARALGLTRSALYRRLDKYQIPYDPSE